MYKGVIREKPTSKEEAREFIKGFCYKLDAFRCSVILVIGKANKACCLKSTQAIPDHTEALWDLLL